MGLLDSFNFDDPKTVGLLSAASNMLAASGPSRTPSSFGQIAANGILGGMQGYQGAREAQAMEELRKLKLDEYKKKLALEEGIQQAARDSFRTPGMMALAGGDGPTPENAAKIPNMQPGFDQQAFLDRMMRLDPIQGIALQQSMAKETPFSKVDPKDYTPESVSRFAQTGNFGDLQPARKMEVVNNQAVDLYNTKPGTVFDMSDPNKPFGMTNGQVTPNADYQQYEINKARAGASRTNFRVNTEKSLLHGIAGGVGESLMNARDSAQGAVGTINTLGRLNEALSSGKVLAGPGSTFKQFGLQIGNQLGINGKDSDETLVNTRQAIQSMAQLELDAAQQMKGQGQITEAERAIIRRAAAGDISEMTKPELGLLINVLDRTARYKIKSYQGQIAPLKDNPNAASIAPFLDVAEPSPIPLPAAKGAIKFLGFE
jgi:hypothetical protein